MATDVPKYHEPNVSLRDGSVDSPSPSGIAGEAALKGRDVVMNGDSNEGNDNVGAKESELCVDAQWVHSRYDVIYSPASAKVNTTSISDLEKCDCGPGLDETNKRLCIVTNSTE